MQNGPFHNHVLLYYNDRCNNVFIFNVTVGNGGSLFVILRVKVAKPQRKRCSVPSKSTVVKTLLKYKILSLKIYDELGLHEYFAVSVSVSQMPSLSICLHLLVKSPNYCPSHINRVGQKNQDLIYCQQLCPECISVPVCPLKTQQLQPRARVCECVCM